MLSIISNDHVFNRFAHYFFPARSLFREVVYWLTELAAAVIFFVYIYQIDMIPMNLYNKEDRVQAWRVRYESVKDISKYTTVVKSQSYTLGYIDKSYFSSPGTSVTLPQYVEYPTDLINREFAWICLCYFIKHFLYMCHTVYMVRNENQYKARSIDFFSPILNGGLWLLWALYGWLNSGNQIHIGWVTQYLKNRLMDAPFKTQVALDAANTQVDIYEQVYEAFVGWKWLWIPTVVIAGINLIVYLICIGKKRSSMYHGNALSTVAIPFQLFFFHLFLTGNWIAPNTLKANPLASEFNGFWQADEAKFADRFSARWVFWILFLGAFAGLAIAAVCFWKGFFDFERCKLSGFKYICYGVFFSSAFVWVMCLDTVVWGFFLVYRAALGASHIVCMVTAILIGAISVLQKAREGDRFIERHNRFEDWFDESFYSAFPPSYLSEKKSEPATYHPVPPSQKPDLSQKKVAPAPATSGQAIDAAK